MQMRWERCVAVPKRNEVMDYSSKTRTWKDTEVVCHVLVASRYRVTELIRVVVFFEVLYRDLIMLKN